jgi:predicted O-methyltransferase YrrM
MLDGWGQAINSWVRWRWGAQGRHGLHAPLLYAWVDGVRAVELDAAVEDERRRMREEQVELDGHDPGAGSRVGGRRTVAQLARVALKPPGQVRALVALGKAVGAREVLELGTCLGVTAAQLAAAGFRVQTVEGHAGIAQRAREGWIRTGKSSSIGLEVRTFGEAIAGWEAEVPRRQWDLIFLDGHHEGDAMRAYIQRLRPLLAPDGCIVCDDIHWSRGMEAAWEAERQAWRTSADAFYFGVLFNRTDLTPGAFKVRLPGTNFGG